MTVFWCLVALMGWTSSFLAHARLRRLERDHGSVRLAARASVEQVNRSRQDWV